MQKSSSVPSLPAVPKTQLWSERALDLKNWTSENRRLLHQRRQHKWLASTGRHGYIDFSDTERRKLKMYFDSLANSEGIVGLEKIETMLVSLGLADTQKEVKDIVDTIDTNGNGQLDFEEYLEIVLAKGDSHISQVFQSMMEGKIGDKDLNFQTVISNYRRKAIMDATGVTAPKKPQKDQGDRILHNFANLQRNRFVTSMTSSIGSTHSGSSIRGDDDELHFGDNQDVAACVKLPWDATGNVPPGGLKMLWRGVVNELKLVSSRPASREGRSGRTLERPPSPTTVIAAIVPKKRRRRLKKGTIMIYACGDEAKTMEV